MTCFSIFFSAYLKACTYTLTCSCVSEVRHGLIHTSSQEHQWATDREHSYHGKTCLGPIVYTWTLPGYWSEEMSLTTSFILSFLNSAAAAPGSIPLPSCQTCQMKLQKWRSVAISGSKGTVLPAAMCLILDRHQVIVCDRYHIQPRSHSQSWKAVPLSSSCSEKIEPRASPRQTYSGQTVL